MKPQIKLLAINETYGYGEELQIKAGQIYGIYAYDENAPIYCCELIPSYFCTPLGFSTQEYLDDDDYDIMMGALADSDDIYIHCHQIIKLPNIEFIDFNSEEYLEEEYREERYWDEITEKFQQNEGYYITSLEKAISEAQTAKVAA